MKIEKINDNQISITLGKHDLEKYDLTINDLLGNRSEKAEELLRELMNVARVDYDFETNDASIVVEAMQINQDYLVFVVTKLGEGENLDPRYELMKRLRDGVRHLVEENDFGEQDGTHAPAPQVKEKEKSAPEEKQPAPLYGVCSFESIDRLIVAAKLSENFYDSDNSLYKNPEDGLYYLVFTRNRNSEEEFDIVSRHLREFGKFGNVSYAARFYVEEHYELLIKDNAMQSLAEM